MKRCLEHWRCFKTGWNEFHQRFFGGQIANDSSSNPKPVERYQIHSELGNRSGKALSLTIGKRHPAFFQEIGSPAGR